MDELLEQFLIEGPELVEQAGADLLALEQRPTDTALIDGVFRAVHTLKGSVGLFDLKPMGAVLHRAEDLLDEIRLGRAAVTTERIDRLLAVVERCGVWLEIVARDGSLGESASEESRLLIDALDLQFDEAGDSPTAPAPGGAGWAAKLRQQWPEATAAVCAVRYRPDLQAYFRGDDPLAIARATPGLLSLHASVAGTTPDDDYDPFLCTLLFEILSSATATDLSAALRFVKDQVEIEALAVDRRSEAVVDAGPKASTSKALRIDGRRIDGLANLADELVVAKNTLLGLPDPDAALLAAQASIDRLTTSLHGEIMRLRLVPLSPVLRRLERQARDLAASLGKGVDLSFRGHGVEADKSLVDGLYEPLLHLVRNALDHGVETQTDRLLAGKTERARLSIEVSVIGDEIEIEISDDGRGMDPARLRATARERGMGVSNDLDALSDRASLELIFAPGFSTAAVVSAVSGRGVGMDAVRTSISALGGRVSVESRIGAGSTFTLRLPLTIIMTQILIVECAGERFGLPLAVVRETARVYPTDVLPVRLGRAIVLREAVLPYLALSDLVGGGVSSGPGTCTAVLVVETLAGRIALGVDGIASRMDVVLKPVTGLLSRVPGALGTTLLGDGGLLVILDVEALLQ
ncbi:MAG: chemotaxis protein CheA [Brevundimonas sp.]